MLEGKEVTHKILEKKDSNIPVRKPKESLSKLNSDSMLEMLNNKAETDTSKKCYINESQRSYATIEYLNKKISDNPEMSSKKIEIINDLKELYELRGIYFINKFTKNPEKNKAIDIRFIDNDINKLQDELRDQEGSGMFTSQNEFVKLLTLLTHNYLLKLILKSLKMIRVNY